jgi:hypothetical protein
LPIERRREAPLAGFSTAMGFATAIGAGGGAGGGDASIATGVGIFVATGGGGGGGGVAFGVLAFSMLSGDAVMGRGESAFRRGFASVGVDGLSELASSVSMCANICAPIECRFCFCFLKKPRIEPTSRAFSFCSKASLARSGCRLGRGFRTEAGIE